LGLLTIFGTFLRLSVLLLVVGGLLVLPLHVGGSRCVGIDLAIAGHEAQVLGAQGQWGGRVGGGVAPQQAEVHVRATGGPAVADERAQEFTLTINSTTRAGRSADGSSGSNSREI
jgi:hypothetical protein